MQQLVLIVEPYFCDTAKILDRFGCKSTAIRVPSPLHAVYALHALQFDVVIVPFDKMEERGYAALFSTMRLVAPASLVVRVPSPQDAFSPSCHQQTYLTACA